MAFRRALQRLLPAASASLFCFFLFFCVKLDVSLFQHLQGRTYLKEHGEFLHGGASFYVQAADVCAPHFSYCPQRQFTLSVLCRSTPTANERLLECAAFTAENASSVSNNPLVRMCVDNMITWGTNTFAYPRCVTAIAVFPWLRSTAVPERHGKIFPTSQLL